MHEITTIGLDLAKCVFQVHAVGQDGRIVLRRQVRRAQMLEFFAKLAPCLIGMEACAFVWETIPRIVSWPSSPHYWARELAKVGHDVRLMPPNYVKPYVKRGSEADQKTVRGTVFPPNDAIDAEAICEGLKPLAQRSIDPGDRWKAQDDPAQHALCAGQDRGSAGCSDDPSGAGLSGAPADSALHRHSRSLGRVRYRHSQGVHNVERLLTLADAASLPAPARQSIQVLADQFRDTHDLIEAISTGIKAEAQRDAVARRLQTVPGIGPITASAIAAACRKNGPPDRFLTLQAAECVELQRGA